MGKRQAQEAPPSNGKSASKKPKVTDVEEEQRKAREYVQNMLAQEAADREALAKAKATPAKTPKGKVKVPTPVLPSPPLAPVLLASPKTNTMKGIKPKTPAPTPTPKSAGKVGTSTKKLTAKELQQVHADAEKYIHEHEHEEVAQVKAVRIKPAPVQRPVVEPRYTEDSEVSTVSSQSMAISNISNYTNNGVLLNLFQVLVMCAVCVASVQYRPEYLHQFLIALAVAVLLWVLYKLWNINFVEDHLSVAPPAPRQYSQGKGKKRN